MLVIVVMVLVIVMIVVVVLDVSIMIPMEAAVTSASFFLLEYFSYTIANMQLRHRKNVVFDQFSLLNGYG